MSIDLGAVPVTGFISPTDNQDTYSTHQARFGKGGYRAVTSIEARDAITADRREIGMLVYVVDDNRLYQLIEGIENEDWIVADIVQELPEDYILKGNDFGVAEASPALIDINLEIIAINEKLDDLIEGSADNITLTGAVYGAGVGTIETKLTPITSDQVTDFGGAVQANSLDTFAVPVDNLDMGGFVIENVGLGEEGTDAANINYVIGYVDTAIVNDTIKDISGTTDQIDISGTVRHPIISLAKTTVTAGSYTSANITVDDEGRLTFAEDGGGGVASITAGTGIDVVGTSTPTISLENTAVSAGSYTNANITVDATGRITAAADGTSGGSDTIKLTGAVTGEGSGTIVTTLSAMTANLSLGNFKITNLDAGSSLTDAVNLRQLNRSLYGGFCTTSGVNAVTNTLVTNTAQKLNGTTNGVYLTNFTTSGNNRLIYTDTSPYSDSGIFEVTGGAIITSTVANIDIQLELFRGGNTSLTTTLPVRIATANVFVFLPLFGVFSLNSTNYVELFIRSTANTTITAANYCWRIKSF